MGFRRPLKYKFIACLFLGGAFLNFEKSKFCTIRTTLSLPLSRQTGEGIGFCQNMIVADSAAMSFNIMFYICFISGINPKHSNLLPSVPSPVRRGKARMGVALQRCSRLIFRRTFR